MFEVGGGGGVGTFIVFLFFGPQSYPSPSQSFLSPYFAEKMPLSCTTFNHFTNVQRTATSF